MKKEKDLNEIRELYRELADKYEVSSFIETDPVQFLHRYRLKQDIEISGFISAWLAFGSRQVFLPMLDKLHTMMDDSPFRYIREKEYEMIDREKGTLYRFCKWSDLYKVCCILNRIYEEYSSMEEWIIDSGETPVIILQRTFGHITQIPAVGGNSACKKLHMFLRWMVRRNSPVDRGIWKKINPHELFVPVDTHVLKQAQLLNITIRTQADRKTVEEITSFAKLIFPDDPARLDFVLYQPPLLNT